MTDEGSLLVVGATPSGIVTAVRAAREGVASTLVSYYAHVGGILANGLSSWDTHFEGRRAPIVDEWLDRIRSHYRETYGPDSPQYQACVNGPFGGGRWSGHMMWEPHVAEAAFEDLLAESDPRITVMRGLRPVAVERAGRRLAAVIFSSEDEPHDTLRLAATTIVDATYEGDVAALAGIPYRIGREARWEFDEQHAGRLFMQRSGAEETFPVGDARGLRYPRDAAAGALNLRPWWGVTQEIFSQSTGEGDGGVQAYNFRVTLSRNPENRRDINRPTDYDRARFAPILATQAELDAPRIHDIKTGMLINPLREFPGILPVPNEKCDWNVAAIPGGADEYPDGDWTTRERVLDDHRFMALGLLYFLQNDDEVPEEVRQVARQWGLPRDEFVDNDNFPREIYIREARRIVGRTIFTENDARIAPGLNRAPVKHDAIAIAEWLMDSHDCSPLRVRGSLGDGFTSMSEVTRPSQIPYSLLFGESLDNLIVSVAMSATHVGWGTIRVEPCLMHIAECVGLAAAIAVNESVDPANIEVARLQRRLADDGSMLTFFNDVDVSEKQARTSAAQYLGSKGFFAGYDARLNHVIDESTCRLWAFGAGELIDGTLDVERFVRDVHRADLSRSAAAHGATVIEWYERETMYRQRPGLAASTAAELGLDTKQALSRGDVCLLTVGLIDAW